MVNNFVLIITPHLARRQMLTRRFKKLEATYQIAYACDLTALETVSEQQHLACCLIDHDLIDETAQHMLHMLNLRSRTIIMGDDNPQLAVQILDSDIGGYIVAETVTATELQVILWRLDSAESNPLIKLIENAPSIYAIIALDSRIKYLNPHGIDTLGNITTLKQFCDGVCQIIDPGHMKRVLQEVLQAGVWTAEVTYQPTPQHPKRDLLVRIVPLFASLPEKPTGYGLIAHDITEVKQADRALQQSVTKSLELNQLKATFVSTISHELRTPLTTISTSTDLLLHYGSQLTPEKRTYRLQKVKLQVKRMVALLDEVLLIERLEDSNTKLSLEKRNVTSLVSELVEDYREQYADTHTILLKADVSAEKRIDARLLRQAISNLLSNALKYSPEGGTVTATVCQAADALRISVRDSGIGIPADDLPKLFTKFHRANNTGAIPGTGLGLAITKRAAEMHAGTIDVTSVVGKGTTFTLCLP